MTVRDVHKIKTTYRAVQWKQDTDSAEDIRGLFDWGKVDGYHYFSDDYEYAELNLAAEKIGHQYHLLKNGQWVVVSSKGKVEVLSEDQYTEKYEDD